MEPFHLSIEIGRLIAKYLTGELTESETQRLNQWIEASEENRKLWNRLKSQEYLQEKMELWETVSPEAQRKRVFDAIRSQTSQPVIRRISRAWMRYAAVLIALVLLGAVTWQVLQNDSGQPETATTAMKSNEPPMIFPKGKVSQLILGDNRVVQLDDTTNLNLVDEDGTNILNSSKMLSYVAIGGDNQRFGVTNTLITPRGGEYRVILSDGTTVWLNAASTLTYSTQFSGDERRVKLVGEAYFEVSKDLNRPFIVETEMSHIKVLGTKFNVNTYRDEAAESIALAEGAVVVKNLRKQNDSVLLKPGYGVTIDRQFGTLAAEKIDLEPVLGWKNEIFIFENESLGSIMRKLARWYDVEVGYENIADSKLHFTGRIRRYENITDVLSLIELTNKVTFSISNKRVRVSSAGSH